MVYFFGVRGGATYLVLVVTQATITRAFVIPLTVITLFIGVFRAARDRAKKSNTA